MGVFNLFALRAVNPEHPDAEYWHLQIHKELRNGRARFGFSLSQESDLSKMRPKIRFNWKKLSANDRNYWQRAAFLLEMKEGDYLLYVDMPVAGKSSLVKIKGKYSFAEPWDPEGKESFRHLLPCEFIADLENENSAVRQFLEAFELRETWSRIVVGEKFESLIRKWSEDKFQTDNIKSPKRVLKSTDIVNDIRNKLSNVQIMSKYGLSEQAMQGVLNKLIRAKAVRPGEVCKMFPSGDDPLCSVTVRLAQREYLEIALPVYEATRPSVVGIVRDISLKGLGVAGIETSVGEAKRLVVVSDYLSRIKSFGLEVVCRWVKKKGVRQNYRAGFEITRISGQDQRNLQDLIDFFACSTCQWDRLPLVKNG